MKTRISIAASFAWLVLAVLRCPAQVSVPASTLPPTGLEMPMVLELTVNAAAEPSNLVIPVPPTADASEPSRIVHYFCRAWKDWDFKTMYGAMTAAYRKEVPYKRFEALFQDDIEFNGGLLDESIAQDPESAGATVRLKVTLRYRSPRVSPRTVIAVAVREGADGFRIAESGLIPLDLDNL